LKVSLTISTPESEREMTGESESMKFAERNSIMSREQVYSLLWVIKETASLLNDDVIAKVNSMENIYDQKARRVIDMEIARHHSYRELATVIDECVAAGETIKLSKLLDAIHYGELLKEDPE
jgi:hypothetical protein